MNVCMYVCQFIAYVRGRQHPAYLGQVTLSAIVQQLFHYRHHAALTRGDLSHRLAIYNHIAILFVCTYACMYVCIYVYKYER